MWTLLALADFFQCCLAVPVLPDWKNEIWDRGRSYSKHIMSHCKKIIGRGIGIEDRAASLKSFRSTLGTNISRIRKNF